MPNYRNYRLKCDEVRPLLSAYLDRELPLWKLGLVRLHLLSCHDCAQEAAELQYTSLSLKNWGDVVAPAGMVDRVMAAIDNDMHMAIANRPRLIKRLIKFGIPAVATAFALLWFLIAPSLFTPETEDYSANTQNIITVKVISEKEAVEILGRGRS